MILYLHFVVDFNWIIKISYVWRNLGYTLFKVEDVYSKFCRLGAWGPK